MGDVVELRPVQPGYQGLVCQCGEAWWKADGVTVDGDGRVTGYTLPLRCVSCGAEARPGPLTR